MPEQDSEGKNFGVDPYEEHSPSFRQSLVEALDEAAAAARLSRVEEKRPADAAPRWYYVPFIPQLGTPVPTAGEIMQGAEIPATMIGEPVMHIPTGPPVVTSVPERQTWADVPLERAEVADLIKTRMDDQGVTTGMLAQQLVVTTRQAKRARDDGLAWIDAITDYFDALGLEARLVLREKED